MRAAINKIKRTFYLSILLLLYAATSSNAWQTSSEVPGEQPSAAEVKELHRDDVVHFTLPGPDSVGSKIKCGLNGDIFAAYSISSSSEYWKNPIRRVSPSSKQITEFPIPTIATFKDLSRLSFDTDSNGVLYALFQARLSSESPRRFAYLIVKYKDTGDVDSFIQLQDPIHRQIQPATLSVFASGNFLVSGTVRDTSAPEGTISVFSAVYSPSGMYRAPVVADISTPANVVASQDPIAVASSLLSVSSSDGNIYILQGNRLKTVSHTGTVERERITAAPEKDLTALQIAQAGAGSIFVFYDYVSSGVAAENAKRRGMINIINTQTGEITQTYRLSQAEPDFAVASCAASLNDFVFLSSDQKDQLQVINYRYK